jgi:hypothetical protein
MIRHINSLRLFGLVTLGTARVLATNSSLSPERYEICENQAQIDALQQEFGLIAVTSLPQKAAMHPGWPETTISIVTFGITLAIYLARNRRREQTLGLAILIWPLVQTVIWTISFVIIECEQATGGWLSITAAITPFIIYLWASAVEDTHIFGPISVLSFLIWVLQDLAAGFLICQRWQGRLGSVAYQIVDSNGCAPYNGVGYLEQGARSRIFRIVQLVEILYSFAIFTVISGTHITRRVSPDEDRMSISPRQSFLQLAAGAAMLLIWIPVLGYEIRIAVMGTPVVISGNCMLVELNPRWGFLDTEIEAYWKALVSLVGM